MNLLKMIDDIVTTHGNLYNINREADYTDYEEEERELLWDTYLSDENKMIDDIRNGKNII